MKLRLTLCLTLLALTAVGGLFAETQGDPKYRPFLYAELEDDMFGPDALCYCAKTGTLYLTVPNFSAEQEDIPQCPPFLTRIENGKAVKIYEFDKAGLGLIGCMGNEFGPDGNLYVCDNQYFFDPDYKSRLLRVVMKDGVPTGDVQVAVDGLKVANAILFTQDGAFLTDTILDEPDKYGSGGVYQFGIDELMKAGTDADHPAITVAKRGDPRLIIIEDCVNVRGNNCGADGITQDKRGIYYFGNYGDGAMYRFRFDKNGKPEVQQIHKGGELFQCVDGICYDEKTDKVYVTDSADNSIWAVVTKPWEEKVEFELIWENDDTDGTDGLLDLPCECRMVNGTLVIVNQDAGIGNTGKNQKTDKPYSLSGIKIY